VSLPDEIAKLGLEIVKQLQIDSLRAEITMFESARAYTAADGRIEVVPEDLRVVAPLALRSRRSSFMVEFFTGQQDEEKEIRAVIDKTLKG
jgi:Mg-chelatase subunit ChlI